MGVNKAIREFKKTLCLRAYDDNDQSPQHCTQKRGHSGNRGRDWDAHEELERLYGRE